MSHKSQSQVTREETIVILKGGLKGGVGVNPRVIIDEIDHGESIGIGFFFFHSIQLLDGISKTQRILQRVKMMPKNGVIDLGRVKFRAAQKNSLVYEGKIFIFPPKFVEYMG